MFAQRRSLAAAAVLHVEHVPHRQHPRWPASVPVHRVEAQAGDRIVFSQRLLHGTVP